MRCAGKREELLEKTDKVLLDLDERIGEKERAPLLARLDLEKDRKTMTDEEWVGLVERYWWKVGSKGCVATELESVADGNEVRLKTLSGMMKKRTTAGHVSQSRDG